MSDEREPLEASSEATTHLARPVIMAEFEPDVCERWAQPGAETSGRDDADLRALRPRPWVYYATASLLTVVVVVPTLFALRGAPRTGVATGRVGSVSAPRPSLHAALPAVAEAPAARVLESAVPASSTTAPSAPASRRDPSPARVRSADGPPRRPRTLDGVDIETPLITD